MTRRAGRKKTIRVVRFAIGHSVRLDQRRFFLQAWRVYALFPDEPAARVFLEEASWPNGPVCPRCKSGKDVGTGRTPYRCNACDRQFTIQIGTIFEGSHVPLHKWLQAILILAMVPQNKKISSLVLSELLCLRRPTVTLMLRKIRAIWEQRETALPGVLNYKRLEFIEEPWGRLSWPFFSDHSKPQPVQLNKEDKDEMPADSYSLEPDDDLVGAVRDRNWEPLPFGYDRDETRARAHGAVFDAYALAGIEKPDDAPSVKVTGLQAWRGFTKRKLTAYIRWQECHFRWCKRRREQTRTHRDNHLRRMPFRWICQRDCPLCRFGTGEWERWAAIALALPLDTWLPFWDWIAEAQDDFTEQGIWYEKWDDDAPWRRKTELRLRRAGSNVRARYERFIRSVDERLRIDNDARESVRLAERERLSAERMRDVEI
jgi:transposase-like protein